MLKRLFGLVVSICLGIFYYARYIEPDWIEVTAHRVTLPRLPKAFHGYRIVQISDIHIDPWMTAERVERVLQLAQKEHADLIVITGDFISRRITYDNATFTRLFSSLSAPDGVFAVPGNHDYYSPTSIARLRRLLDECGVVDLSNAVRTIERDGAQLHLAGIDDVVARKARLDVVLDHLPENSCAILLAHEPDFADIIAPYGRFDLQLSGHTHGGQVRIPVLGALISPKHGRRYHKGWYRIDNLRLYVNRGVGMVTLTLRFNCRPEIAVFTLNAPNNVPL